MEEGLLLSRKQTSDMFGTTVVTAVWSSKDHHSAKMGFVFNDSVGVKVRSTFHFDVFVHS